MTVLKVDCKFGLVTIMVSVKLCQDVVLFCG